MNQESQPDPGRGHSRLTRPIARHFSTSPIGSRSLECAGTTALYPRFPPAQKHPYILKPPAPAFATCVRCLVPPRFRPRARTFHQQRLPARTDFPRAWVRFGPLKTPDFTLFHAISRITFADVFTPHSRSREIHISRVLRITFRVDR